MRANMEMTYGIAVQRLSESNKSRNPCSRSKLSKVVCYMNLLLIIIFLLSLSGCGSSRIFHADFELDAVGALPNANPPTEPTGDTIWLATREFGGGDHGHAVSIISDGAISGKSLRYSNTNIPALVREIRFYSTEISTNNNVYWAIWKGRLENLSADSSPLEIHFGNLTLGTAAFKIRNGELFLRRGGSEQGFVAIGRISQVKNHQVVIQVDYANRVFDFTLEQENGRLEAEGIPLSPGSPSFREDRLDIQVRFSGDNHHSSASYVMDDIEISQSR